jgi:triphosphoribosyl-dephospho-CoA synthase
MHANVHSASCKHDAARNLQRSNRLAALATQALIAEAELTPKPGLVDQRGSGAHDDLSLDLMRLSATVLEPFFAAMSSRSTGREVDTSLREELAEIGRGAERAMFKVTHGSNTHKGAIWTLGLLIAAAGCRVGQNAREIAAVAGAIARLPDRAQPQLITHGDIARSRYGAFGARGEACKDFPHVVRLALPALREQRAKGYSEEVSRLDALLSVMCQLNDTCVLYRGGIQALDFVKSGARAVLTAGGCGSAQGKKQLRAFDRELIAKHISPGGSADLLAATIFVDAFERQQSEIRNNQSGSEDRNGAA